jgi:hypothetical protein
VARKQPLRRQRRATHATIRAAGIAATGHRFRGIFRLAVNAFVLGPTFTNVQFFNAGDTLDFAVRFWKQWEFLHDTTGIEAKITNVSPTPVPSTLVMSSILFGMFGAVGVRKWMKTATAV